METGHDMFRVRFRSHPLTPGGDEYAMSVVVSGPDETGAALSFFALYERPSRRIELLAVGPDGGSPALPRG